MTGDFPELGDWTATRDALHGYSTVLGSIRRALSPPHPRWWQISLRVRPAGLTSGPLAAATAGPGSFELLLDLEASRLRFEANGQLRHELPLDRGASPAELGGELLGRLARLGIGIAPDRGRWAEETAAGYRRADAARYRRALWAVAATFRRVRAEVGGEVGPVQLWPHHFDLSWEWFGTRTGSWEEDGETRTAAAHVGYGFSTGDDSHPGAYFYALPWPFDAELTGEPLPRGASWHTASWEGALLPYAAVSAGGGSQLLTAFLRATHRAAAPRLA